MEKTFKTQVQKKAKELNMKIGCWDNQLETLSKKYQVDVLDNMEFESDTFIRIKRQPNVCQIDIVDGEIDFKIISKNEYINRYMFDELEFKEKFQK